MTKTIRIVENILSSNDNIALENRVEFDANEIKGQNFIRVKLNPIF